MQLRNASDADGKRLIAETRALFILKRMSDGDADRLEWTWNVARVLADSPNRAIAAEARRLSDGFGEPYRRPRIPADPSQPGTVLSFGPRARSERDRHQRIEAATVADHEALGEA